MAHHEVDKDLVDLIKSAFNLDTLLFLDFETFFKSKGSAGNKSYSLKSLTYPEYILGERFEYLGVAVAEDTGDSEYLHEPQDLEELFSDLQQRIDIEEERIGLLCWNTAFDGSILSWREGIRFAFYFDAMLMHKLLRTHLPSSLKNAALDMWPDDAELHKGGAELMAVDGLEYRYISAYQHEQLERYAIQDNDLTRLLFMAYFYEIADAGLMIELQLIHQTLRAAIIPQFLVDDHELDNVIASEEAKRQKQYQVALDYCRSKDINWPSEKTFRSQPKTVELLQEFGLEVPTDGLKKDGKPKYKTGKDDPDYIRLRIDNPHLEDVFKARELGASNIKASRAKRIGEFAELFRGQPNLPAELPFFLNYYGAGQTGRWSGGQKINQQNLTADRAGNGSDGHHRRAHVAPPGYVIGVCDLSNIEMRVNMWFSGQNDILEQVLSPDYDYYCDVASGIFGFEVIKSQHKYERQMGKAAGLGLGFAMGWNGFQNYLASGPLGMDPMFKSDDFCKTVKREYEAKHPGVVKMWSFLDKYVLRMIAAGAEDEEMAFGPGNIFTAKKDRIILPSGRVLRYHNAYYKGEETPYGMRQRVVFSTIDKNTQRPKEKGAWHGLIIENCVQAAARDILAEMQVRVERELKKAGLGVVIGSVHDEILAFLPEARADEAFAIMEREMSIAPAWAKGLPLENEGGWAKEYSK